MELSGGIQIVLALIGLIGTVAAMVGGIYVPLASIRSIERTNKTIIDLIKVNSEQQVTIDRLTITGEALVVALDGLPKAIAEEKAITVRREAFVLVLQQALIRAGVARADQPQEELDTVRSKLTLDAELLVAEAVVEEAKEEIAEAAMDEEKRS